jgi:anti-sigma factor ChrR (cupin superfamily)
LRASVTPAADPTPSVEAMKPVPASSTPSHIGTNWNAIVIVRFTYSNAKAVMSDGDAPVIRRSANQISSTAEA